MRLMKNHRLEEAMRFARMMGRIGYLEAVCRMASDKYLLGLIVSSEY